MTWILTDFLFFFVFFEAQKFVVDTLENWIKKLSQANQVLFKEKNLSVFAGKSNSKILSFIYFVLNCVSVLPQILTFLFVIFLEL
jgi:hypothetical protein